MPSSLAASLQRSLSLRNSELTGCPRQNRLSGMDNSWRMARGNALCALHGYKVNFNTPIEEIDVFATEIDDGLDLITFRGGRWKEWWNWDIRILLSLAKLYLSDNVSGAIVLHEVDNSLSEVYIESPNKDEASALVQTVLNRWKDYARIPKNSPRALALCGYCPVKARCDALDLEKGETSDWPNNYQPG